MCELREICNLQLRRLDMNLLPYNLRDIKTFSWKILILAVNKKYELINLKYKFYFFKYT